jgi:hypothetical protein
MNAWVSFIATEPPPPLKELVNMSSSTFVSTKQDVLEWTNLPTFLALCNIAVMNSKHVV